MLFTIQKTIDVSETRLHPVGSTITLSPFNRRYLRLLVHGKWVQSERRARKLCLFIWITFARCLYWKNGCHSCL